MSSPHLPHVLWMDIRKVVTALSDFGRTRNDLATRAICSPPYHPAQLILPNTELHTETPPEEHLLY